MTPRILLLSALLLSPAAATGKDRVDPDPSGLLEKAGAVRATADELRFKEIPWVTDVFEGFRLALEEKRPVFLYVITGDPLGDC